ncbi:filamentous hemagglutinin N-terminal domain-containing protein [Azotobacter chroococcum subsp. isscasi]|uniref:two-partner secretion domain-containing protein n=1 Tax=Azotobacter chroococcum TaxID=353 RepID=UPI00103E3696|nr:filamentous hemagglutinin N-terminal domain-containing protein [Azotobacter chroococcum]TBW08319.1 filamentous hemagglutinin N-terminal domain-containing protein [Azotobacter chroococcum subsp. isscasi]
MNRIFNVIWSHTQSAWVVTSEHAAKRGKPGRLRLPTIVLCLSPLSLLAADLPEGGQVVLGNGSIGTSSGNNLQIQQNSSKMAINWQSFNIGADKSVTFQQPDSSAIALNRVIGSDGSAILGKLDANGQVFLINPNGILFGQGASVNVGGLVASTLDITNEDFEAGNYRFKGNGHHLGGVSNLGSITASDGGAVALLGGQVSNDGVIQAKLGTVALAAGDQITLDFAGDGLLNVQVDQAAADALARNGNLIKADGGTVLMTARSSDALLKTVVNNEGVIEAQTLGSRNGKIALLGDMDLGIVQVGGTLDASAPDGGDGGFIETSGATVQVADTAKVTTKASTGKTGTWRIDPSNFTIGAGSSPTGSNIGADTLSASLASTNVEIATGNGGAEPGDINVNAAVSWDAGTTLTLTAHNDININADITASGDSAGLALNHGSNATYRLLNGSSVTLSGSGASFSVNGDAYTVIQTLAALQGVGSSDLGGRYVLGNDIVASDTSLWNSGAGFEPIGNGSSPFSGVFDGLGHTISGLTINRSATDNVGLFGATQGATIRQLGLTGATINGLNYVGSLVGQATSGTIEAVYATGSVSGYQYVGGLAGSNSGLIANSHSIGGVGGESFVGGLVGSNSGQLINTFALGSVIGTASSIGGLAGYNSGVLMGNFTVGDTTGNTNVGGLLGTNDSGIVAGNYSIGLVSGNTNVGGLVGSNIGGIVAANYSNAIVSGDTNVGGLVGLNFAGLVAGGGFGAATLDELASLFGLDSGVLLASGYSIGGLLETATSSGLTEFNDSTLFAGSYGLDSLVGISTLEDLQALVDSKLAAIGYSIADLGGLELPGGAFELDSSMLGDYADLLGSVSGNTNVGGLVGGNASGIVAGSHNFGNVYGYTNVGGLVGGNSGLVIGNSASGTVMGEEENTGGLVGYNAGSIKVNYATGDVAGKNRVGGLVGYNSGSIDTNYAAGNVAIGTALGGDAGGLVGANTGSIESSFATGNVSSASSRSGGLVGSNAGLIANTYASGSVSGTSEVGGLVGYNIGYIDTSYAIGNVAGTSGNIGALLGYNGGGIARSYWNATTAGSLPGIGGGNLSGASGLTDEQMMQMDSYAGWSISDRGGSSAVWRIYEGHTTPLLRAFMTPLTITSDNVTITYDGTVWEGGSSYTTGSITPNFWHRSPRVNHSLIYGTINTSQPARNAGSYAIDGGLYSSQLGYDISYDPGTLTIEKALLILSASSDSKIYDGTTTSSGMVGVSGLATGDTLTATQEYDSAEVGERTLLVNEAAIEDGNGGNNYEVIRQSASGLILAATDNGGGTGGDGGSGGDGGTGGDGGSGGNGGTGGDGGSGGNGGTGGDGGSGGNDGTGGDGGSGGNDGTGGDGGSGGNDGTGGDGGSGGNDGTGGDGGSGGNGGNGNQRDEDTFVRLSPAYLASLATKEPCRTADQQLDVRQRYRCPVVKVSQDQAAIETAPYAIENGGLRLPEGI